MKRAILPASICFWLTSAAFAQEQKVTVDLKQRPLTELFSSIEKQTPYRFSYRDIVLQGKGNVTISEQNVPTKQVLANALHPLGLDFELQSEKNIVIFNRTEARASTLSGPAKRVKGTITDASGIPIIGANVMVKGTTNGTITDLDGNFSLEVSEGDLLEISYIGYLTQTQQVGKESTLAITMTEDSKQLEEVVVVGFGTQKKVNLTGAVSTVDSETFEDRPVQNVAMMLQGVMPGLNITKTDGTMDAAPTINIRGTTTIGEGSDGSPLILIDGMEGDMNMLNPQDIESVSVLKDAAASSIYGSRAPFGVILITTKKGKEGRFTVNYNNSLRWNTPVKRPHTVDSYRFATYFNDAAINAKATGKFTPERMQRIRDYMDGKITTVNIPDPNNPTVWADGYDYANANVDWWDVLFNKWTFSQEHTASMMGGTDKIQAYASINFLDAGGMMKLSEDTYK